MKTKGKTKNTTYGSRLDWQYLSVKSKEHAGGGSRIGSYEIERRIAKGTKGKKYDYSVIVPTGKYFIKINPAVSEPKLLDRFLEITVSRNEKSVLHFVRENGPFGFPSQPESVDSIFHFGDFLSGIIKTMQNYEILAKIKIRKLKKANATKSEIEEYEQKVNVTFKREIGTMAGVFSPEPKFIRQLSFRDGRYQLVESACSLYDWLLDATLSKQFSIRYCNHRKCGVRFTPRTSRQLYCREAHEKAENTLLKAEITSGKKAKNQNEK